MKKDMELSNKPDNGPEGIEKEDVAENGNTSSCVESSKENPSNNTGDEPPPKRVARHRRKGIPQHAPFF